MGLKCGHADNYQIDNLNFSQVLALLQHCKLRRLDDDNGPVVDVDASWVVRRVSCCTYDMRVISRMRLCLLFIRHGCRVNIVFDGVTRHHSKRSTTKRTVDCYRTKIDMHVAKCELIFVSDEHKHETTEERKSHYNNRMLEIKKKNKDNGKKDVRDID
jgi:hypothetical protein